jgi:hypothetical protein
MTSQTELEIEKEMKTAFAFFLENGFSYRYFYEKGGDSSCVYIYRFQKGRDFFDLREVSGGDELNFVVFSNGEYQFPSLKYLYKKQFRVFNVKHFFSKPTKQEKRAFFAELLTEKAKTGDFFGILGFNG